MRHPRLIGLALLAALGSEPRTDFYGDPLPPGAVARLGTLRLRHAEADLCFAADGKTLLTCGRDGTARVWDAATGNLLRRTRLAWNEGREVYAGQIVLSPDGASAAIWQTADPGASVRWAVRVHDTATGKERGRLPVACGIYPCLAFSPDGKLLFAQVPGDKQPTLQLWDAATLQRRKRLTPIDGWARLEWAAFSPDGKYLLGEGRCDRYPLHRWDVATGAETTPPNRLKGTRDLAFAPDGKRLAVHTSDVRAAVLLLDAADWKVLKELSLPADRKECYVGRLAFSPDGRTLAAAYAPSLGSEGSRGVVLWNADGGGEPRFLADATTEDTYLTFSPDGRTLACHEQGNVFNPNSEVRLWDVASGRRRRHGTGHATPVPALAVSPDGRTLASCAGHTRELWLWDVAAGRPTRRLQRADHWIDSCSSSADGSRLLTAEGRGQLQVWDVSTGRELRRFLADDRPSDSRGDFTLSSVALAAGGDRVLALTVVKDDDSAPARVRVRAWDVATGRERPWDRAAFVSRVRAAAPGSGNLWHTRAEFAPDGERMAVTLNERVGIVEVATGRVLAETSEDVYGLRAFSPDGRLLAVWRDAEAGHDEEQTLMLVETATGEEIARRPKLDCRQAAFTADGRALVVRGRTELTVFDTATGERLHRLAWPDEVLDAHGDARVCSLAVLPSGRVATGMAEGDILIWNLPAADPDGRKGAGMGGRQLDALWADLAGPARPAYRAVAALSAAPAQAVPFLKDRLRPVPGDGRLQRLLADLDSDEFPVREAASRELARQLYRAVPALHRALEGRPSPEARRRIEVLLNGPRHPPAEALRTLRAIAVLERVGTSQARRVLEALAGGADTPETREAKAALQRLSRR